LGIDGEGLGQRNSGMRERRQGVSCGRRKVGRVGEQMRLREGERGVRGKILKLYSPLLKISRRRSGGLKGSEIGLKPGACSGN